MKAERVVLDTNVLISAALLPKSGPAEVVRYVLARCQPVFSDDTFRELETRLWRPKFDRYLDIDTRKALLRDFSAVAHWVAPDSLATTGWSRDPDDDKFIAAALAAEAIWLVSGDGDLLELAERFTAPQILSPVEALARIASGG